MGWQGHHRCDQSGTERAPVDEGLARSRDVAGASRGARHRHRWEARESGLRSPRAQRHVDGSRTEGRLQAGSELAAAEYGLTEIVGQLLQILVVLLTDVF